jgi:putative transposase
MKINLAYKTELDLNDKQRSKVNQGIGGARFAYNWGLERRKKLYETEKKSTTAINQHLEFNALKESEFPWTYESSKCVFQEALRDLETAYRNWFRNLKNGTKKGFPKFKSKHDDKQSFRLTGAIHVQEDSIQLPRLGVLRLKEENYLPLNKKILSATVSKHAGRYFVSVSIEDNIEIPLELQDKIIGVDLGIKHLAITSDGIYFENPTAYRRFLKKLKRMQRQHSRKVKGSNNRRKSQQKLQRLHFKTSNIRKDTIHKMTTELVRTKPATIVIEDLSSKNMMRNHNLAMSLADSSLGEIRRQLEYKTMWSGINLIFADRFFPSSKMCSGCGAIKKDLTLSDRTYHCEECGLEIDRDLNASLNLKHYQPKTNTASSAGINALGEDKLQARKSQWSSLNKEHNIKVYKLNTCQLSTSL